MENFSSTVLKTGVLAGTSDIVAACLQYYLQTGKNPVNVLKFVASGIFGNAAFSGGAMMAFAGLLFHFLITIGFTFLFFIIYGKMKIARISPVASAIVYGAFMWAFMQFGVMSFANTPPVKIHFLNAVTAIIILIVCIGLPVAFAARRYYARQQ